MKKGIALLLVLAMLLGFGAAAEEIELAHLSDEQVVALMRRVQEEIAARHIEKTATLAGGSYIAGRDIPAGSYVYTCLAAGDDWGSVTICSEEGEGKQRLWEVVSAPDAGGSTGNVLHFVEARRSTEIGRALQPDDLRRSGVPIARLPPVKSEPNKMPRP